MKAMLAGGEEAGRSALCEALRALVLQRGGTLPPPKKRGVGAEVLGLVNSLLQSSHSEGSDVLASQGVLAWALAVIDSMQRSSTKQLHTHINSALDDPQVAQEIIGSIASYEIRGVRERDIIDKIQMNRARGLSPSEMAVEAIKDICDLVETPAVDDGPIVVDVQHSLLLAAGYVPPMFILLAPLLP
jgi:hypothetical protein